MRTLDGRSWVARLLGLPEPAPPTRLTADEAVALAATSPAVSRLERALSVANARRDGERIVWNVCHGGVGAQWWVEVDDATGEVGPLHHRPGR